jgi:hypothetical protein
MFKNQARVERYNISKVLFACKLTEVLGGAKEEEGK